MLAERRRSLRPIVACLLGFLGCAGEPKPKVIDAPDEPLYVALLSYTNGTLSKSTGLVRWNPGEGLPLFANTEQDHVIVGYTDDDLAALSMLDADVLRDSALRATVGCEPPLPSPSWRARWTAGEPAPTAATEELPVPSLTAPWLFERCESIEGSRWMVETSCNDFGVFPTVIPTESRCVWDLTLTTYELPPLRGRLWYDGRVCAELAEPTPACGADPEDPAVVSCSGTEPCRLTVGLNDHSAPPFTSRNIEVLPGVEPYRDSRFEDSREFRATRTRVGWTRDMVVLEDRIWVAAFDQPVDTCPRFSMDHQPSKFMRVDRADLTVVTTATAPACVTQLVEDTRGGFLATHVEDDTNWITRYDRDGRQLETRRLGTGPGDPVSDVFSFHAWSLELLSTGDLAVLMTDIYFVEEQIDSKLLLLDPETLEERARLESLGQGLAHFMTEVGNGQLAVAFEGTNAVQYVDLGGPSLGLRVPFEHDPGIGTHGLGFQNSELYYAAFTVLFAFDVRTGQESWREPVSARPMAVLRVAPWPRDPNLLAVFGLSPRQFSPFVTLLTFVDRRTGRFLPGVYEIGGLGPPHEIQPDGAGGYYVLQPWGAQLTHITPKNP